MGKKLLILGLLFFVTHASLTAWYAHVMRGSSLIQSDRHLQSLPDSMDILVMGNSHAMSINPALWDGTQNMATSGEKLHQTYYKLKYVLETREKRAANVIMPCDLMTLWKETVDHTPYQYYWNRYVDEGELVQFSEHSLDFTMHRLLNTLFPYKDGEKDIMDYYLANEGSRIRAQARALAKIRTLDEGAQRQLTDSCAQAQISEYGRFYLNKIIELCEEHDSRLSFVRFPVTPHYFFEESYCFNPEEHYQTIRETFLQQGKTIPMYDFHDAFPLKAFRDPHHLHYGEECDRFTLQLKAEFKKK